GRDPRARDVLRPPQPRRRPRADARRSADRATLMDTSTLAPPITPADVETVVGAPMSYWRTVAWRLRQDPATIVAGALLLLIAFPAVLLAIAISGSLGPGLWNTLISLSVVFIPRVVRVAESATVQVKSLEFVAAARASGSGVWPIMRHHLLANVLGPVLVFSSTQ